MKIDFNNTEPIYIQIENYIKKQIVSKEIKGGEKLPSVRDLSSSLKVNPNTIQRAYSELEREELAYTKRGTGKFITEDENIINNLKIDMAKEIVNKFILDMSQLGFEKENIMEMLRNKIKE